MAVGTVVAALGLAAAAGLLPGAVEAGVPTPSGTPPILLAHRASAGAAPTASSARWSWPLAGDVQVLRAFDWREPDWQPGHRGVDLLAATGDLVLAPSDGVLTFAGQVAGRGVVSVDHGELRSSFEPVEALVEKGRWVQRGQAIARVAQGGKHCGTQACLHWGVRRGEEYIDPALLVGQRRYAVLLE